MSLEIRPITYRAACSFIDELHRHHKAPRGCKWAIGCYEGETLVGVATAGRPVARGMDDGLTCEVTRLCTDGTYNSCSMLYGACARIAKAMGYRKIITYILDSEPGTSLKASGWKLSATVEGRSWNCSSRPREDTAPTCDKQRYEKNLF